MPGGRIGQRPGLLQVISHGLLHLQVLPHQVLLVIPGFLVFHLPQVAENHDLSLHERKFTDLGSLFLQTWSQKIVTPVLRRPPRAATSSTNDLYSRPTRD